MYRLTNQNSTSTPSRDTSDKWGKREGALCEFSFLHLCGEYEHHGLNCRFQLGRKWETGGTYVMGMLREYQDGLTRPVKRNEKWFVRWLLN
ncbi:hypothetical protein JTE90_014110 [Oedothorax gibbosus]|uniref:Uncharacterized protein n=1 Tax=Oedothorax gibbosus TaxID=931172 RepID=A0AAV6V8Q1_9ARAC|nr:hypothetical protein JTE90_014110 [Oedothorax gibbosus]